MLSLSRAADGRPIAHAPAHVLQFESRPVPGPAANFAKNPEWLVFAKISPTAKALFDVLSVRRNYKTDKVIMLQGTMAVALGISARSVRRALTELIAIGAVSVAHRGRKTANRYDLHLAEPTTAQHADKRIVSSHSADKRPPVSDSTRVRTYRVRRVLKNSTLERASHAPDNNQHKRAKQQQDRTPSPAVLKVYTIDTPTSTTCAAVERTDSQEIPRPASAPRGDQRTVIARYRTLYAGLYGEQPLVVNTEWIHAAALVRHWSVEVILSRLDALARYVQEDAFMAKLGFSLAVLRSQWVRITAYAKQHQSRPEAPPDCHHMPRCESSTVHTQRRLQEYRRAEEDCRREAEAPPADCAHEPRCASGWQHLGRTLREPIKRRAMSASGEQTATW